MSGRQGARDKLLQAAMSSIRKKGYSATTVDDLCTQAGVTKGAFFHHFKSKDELGVAAAEHWSTLTATLFEAAPYHDHADPLDRVLAYLSFRRSMLRGDLAQFSCVAGTMVQEVFHEHPQIRDACAACILGHAQTLVADIREAMDKYGVAGDWTAESLAAHTQAVIQGAFILAKAKDDPALAADSVDHLIRYVELLFGNRLAKGIKAKKRP